MVVLCAGFLFCQNHVVVFHLVRGLCCPAVLQNGGFEIALLEVFGVSIVLV